MRRAGQSRRAFLAGAGAMITLPFLPSLWTGRASGASTRPMRFFAWYVPDGIHMADFTPGDVGAAYTLSPILDPLAAIRDDVLVISGLRNEAAIDDIPGDHSRGTASFLTCARADNEKVSVGISLDQVMAQQQPTTMNLPSLQVSMEPAPTMPVCDGGLPCGYVASVSYADATTGLPNLISPVALFDRLFAPLEAGFTQADRDRHRVMHSSILDGVTSQTNRLRQKVSGEDGRRVEEFLTGLRALELRVQNSVSLPACQTPPRPEEEPDVPTRLELMVDLMVAAFVCDLTRVTTFMTGTGATNQAFPFLGIPESHHELSHHQFMPDKLAKLTVIDRWEVAMYASFLEKLRAVPEGDGTLLDHTIALFSSEVSDGNIHLHTDLPVLVGGGRAGGIQSGQHFRADGEPIADLYMGFLSAMGMPQATFGLDGTRVLPGLLP